METKEDIIQMFMTELDNSAYKDEILKVISKEDVNKLLNEEIKEVKYTDKEHGFTAEYNKVDKIIYINKVRDNIKTDNKEKLNKIIIIHEMWHAISKGLEKYETTARGIVKTGLAFTEGMTQLMAERMLGYSLIGSYQIEKEIIAILENFTGRENIISDYIYGTSKVEEELDKKYGKQFLYIYKHLRKAMDTNLEITNKLIGEMSIDEEENQDSLLDKQKQKKEFIKNVLGRLIQIEKDRVEEVNQLEVYKDYDKLLKRLSYSQSEEIRNLEIFDLEEEMKINEVRIESFKGRIDKNAQNGEHNMQMKIQTATSEITISGLNNQIRNIKKNVREIDSERENNK